MPTRQLSGLTWVSKSHLSGDCCPDETQNDVNNQ